jgi:hypothetical protein
VVVPDEAGIGLVEKISHLKPKGDILGRIELQFNRIDNSFMRFR